MIKISPKAFFFDFDGVICDSERAHMFAALSVSKAYKINFSEEYYFEKLFGFDDKQLFAHLFKKHGKELPEQTLKKLIKKKNTEFMQLVETDIIYFDGVVDLIQNLAKKNIPLAIVSGALEAEIKACLEKGDLTKYFKFIISANSVENCKPDPECYNMAYDKMKVYVPLLRREDSWVLEDSPAGLYSANEAGLQCIAISNSTPESNLSPARHIISHYKEIIIP